MKTLIQGAVSVALLLSGNLVYAATATADIPMSVEVPRVCTISASPSIVVPRDGSDGTGNFRIICNVDAYDLRMTTDSLDMGALQLKNSNGYALPINIRYSFMYKSQYTWTDVDLVANYPWRTQGIDPIGEPLDTILKVKLNTPTTALTPAGTYTDTFRVNVIY